MRGRLEVLDVLPPYFAAVRLGAHVVPSSNRVGIGIKPLRNHVLGGNAVRSETGDVASTDRMRRERFQTLVDHTLFVWAASHVPRSSPPGDSFPMAHDRVQAHTYYRIVLFWRQPFCVVSSGRR
ncbi:hypothetical protein [Haloquadratum walsbyi]|uniref:Uncharacterized protein n=1 Tax=Haloquadratum walsbyi J07HQW2 TaxID=1238425 RepID=U1NF54_9EURY|nr:hypothetical protein [Haloquadratum walsbyi]ERG95700.1 MAG: hypothetical protein J07HQW2_02160 [Haloquadratum walsbyi J07HQW2]